MNRNTVLSALVLMATALYSLSSAAQSPPLAPILTEMNVDPPSHTGSSYDLAAAIADAPFTVNLPAEPVITSEATCTTAQQITDSLAVNGRRTIIAAGTYSMSTIYVGGNDKHIVFQPGVTLDFGSGSFRIESASRVRLDGARGLLTGSTGHLVRIYSSSDIRLDGLDVRNTGIGQGMLIAETGAQLQRIALVGIDLESNESPIYHGAPGTQDFVIANSRIFSATPYSSPNGWAVRHEGEMTRGVFIDSYFRSIQNTVIRQPGGGTDIYYARNQIDYGPIWGFRTEASTTITRLSLIDNAFYAILGEWNQWGGARIDAGSTITSPTYTGNTLRSPNASPWFSDTSANPVTITSDVNPPIWEMQ